MNVRAHAYFATTEADMGALRSDLTYLQQALGDERGSTAAPHAGRPVTLKSLVARLDKTIAEQPEAASSVELAIPYHPDHVDLRPARITLDAIRGAHAYVYAFGRYQTAMFTITTAWPIASLQGRIQRGVVIAPTTAFSRHLPGYPSPFARYMAFLSELERAEALRVPTLLLAIEPA